MPQDGSLGGLGRSCRGGKRLVGPADSTPPPVPAGGAAEPVLVVPQREPDRSGAEAEGQVDQRDARVGATVGALDHDGPGPAR